VAFATLHQMYANLEMVSLLGKISSEEAAIYVENALAVAKCEETWLLQRNPTLIALIIV